MQIEHRLQSRRQSSRRIDLRTTGSPHLQIFLERNTAPRRPAVNGAEVLDATVVGFHLDQHRQNRPALVIAQAFPVRSNKARLARNHAGML